MYDCVCGFLTSVARSLRGVTAVDLYMILNTKYCILWKYDS